MKTKLTILAMLLCVVTSCIHKPKSRIEERFERYAKENFYDPDDFQGFSAITQTDSMDVVQIAKEFMELSDTLNSLLWPSMESMASATQKSDYSTKRRYASELLSLGMRSLNTKLEASACIEDKEKLTQIISGIDPDKTKNRMYTLKARIKGKTETVRYYALDCAMVDSIIISNSEIKISEMPDTLQEVLGLIDKIKDNCEELSDLLKGMRQMRTKLKPSKPASSKRKPDGREREFLTEPI